MQSTTIATPQPAAPAAVAGGSLFQRFGLGVGLAALVAILLLPTPQGLPTGSGWAT